MIRVNPEDRPDCSELLDELHQIRPELKSENYMDSENYQVPEIIHHDPMLDTINLPYDLKMLDRRLPRSNYEQKNAPAEYNEKRNQSASTGKGLAAPLPSNLPSLHSKSRPG